MDAVDVPRRHGGYGLQRCVRCVMDITAPDIEFDEEGTCNYCREFATRIREMEGVDEAQRERTLRSLTERIKVEGRHKKYDCIIGVSGGVDSSWALVKAVELGLRPLAVHMDNGWNSELASHNISTLIDQLDVELYTHLVDWSEYHTLMQACFDQDVIDVELLYDNAMLAVNYLTARNHGVRYILSGSNTASEGMRMPPGWNWYKYDARNIRALAESKGLALRTFPTIGTVAWLWFSKVRRIRWVKFLDYFEYRIPQVVDRLVRDFGYQPYPYKHYESVFTRLYQGYILPEKFGVDKRKLHLSSLIVSGSLTREDAISDLAGIAYPSEQDLNDDIEVFLRRMGWSRDQWKEYLGRAPRPHSALPTERPLFEVVFKTYQRLRSMIV